MLEIVKSFLNPGEPRQSGTVQGSYYERTGSCNQCGKCCSHIYLVHGQKLLVDEEHFESLKKENHEYAYFKVIDRQPDGLLFQCVHLQDDKSCGVYNDRPDFCRKYPSEHSILMGGKLADGCGYQFRLLKSFQDVLKDMGGATPVKPFGEVPLQLAGNEPVEGVLKTIQDDPPPEPAP